jgi:hypothetical protein
MEEKMLRKWFVVTVLTGMMSSGHVHAQEVYPVISGGIGETEMEQLRAVEDRYTAKLVFVGQNGMYLSDVDVVIQDAHGSEVLHVLTKGPVLLAGLPEGKYSVHAQVQGHVRKQNITVKAQGTKKPVYLRFPIKDE